jgi:hypothetical protein
MGGCKKFNFLKKPCNRICIRLSLIGTTHTIRAPYIARVSAFFSDDVIPEMDYYSTIRAIEP